MKQKNNEKFVEIPPDVLKRLLHLPKDKAVKIIRRINEQFHEQKEKILQQAYDEDLFTKQEYEEQYKDMFYDDFGSDSFIQYINAAINAKTDFFVTNNERLIKSRKQLQKRFRLKIATPEEIIKKEDIG